MAKFQNVFAGMKGIFMFVAVMVLVSFVASCDKSDNELVVNPQHDTTVVVTPGDTIIKNDTTKVYVDKDWTLVRLDTINKGDSLLITVTVEANDGEKHILKGFSTIYPEEDGYEIFEEDRILYPSYSNKGMRGGNMVKEDITDSGYVAVNVWAAPTNDGNIVYTVNKMQVLKKVPVIRAKSNTILSLDEPMQTRAVKYKVGDAPIAPFAQIDYETEGLVKDQEFSTILHTKFDRDMMAYDEFDKALLNDTSRVNIDDKTDNAVVELKLVNKSGSSSLRSYNILCNRNVETIKPQEFIVKELVENYSSTKDFAVVVPEKEVYADSIWRKLAVTKLWSSKFVGGATINTDYRVYLERPIFSKFGITVDFGYGKFEVKEGNSDLDQVTSDRAEYDKGVFTNRINTTYMGSYKQSFSELSYLYKKVEFQDEIVKRYSDDARKKKSWTLTSETFKCVIIEEWKSGKKDEYPFEWTRQRGLEAGPEYDRICKDNYNYTSTPSITIKSSSKVSKTGEKGEEWEGKEEKGVISSDVEFNGAEKAVVSFSTTETNDVVFKWKDVVVDYGHDNYKFTLKPALGTSSVKGDYTVYPYTAVLNYVFGGAEAKSATDKGTIRVAVPEEETFFPKTWGKLQYVEQTTTISENQKKWDYVLSLHFYYEKTKEYRVLPVILAYATPDVPKWDFSLVEVCEKRAYELYNSAFYMPDGIKNAWAEDNREHMQWSIAVEGTDKMAYGSMRYRTAEDKAWDWESAVNGHATVKTHRYELTVTDGRLFVKDTYNNTKITDSHCVNGGWK